MEKHALSNPDGSFGICGKIIMTTYLDKSSNLSVKYLLMITTACYLKISLIRFININSKIFDMVQSSSTNPNNFQGQIQRRS